VLNCRLEGRHHGPLHRPAKTLAPPLFTRYTTPPAPAKILTRTLTRDICLCMVHFCHSVRCVIVCKMPVWCLNESRPPSHVTIPTLVGLDQNDMGEGMGPKIWGHWAPPLGMGHGWPCRNTALPSCYTLPNMVYFWVKRYERNYGDPPEKFGPSRPAF